MTCHICVTCGVQHVDSEQPPARCAICEDERQYVGWGGQRWTTLSDMADRYRNQWEEQEPGLVSLRTEPHFGIGQRAFLVQTPAGNLLWDCISLLDDATVAAVAERGGIDAIAISHPHFYGTCVEWSAAFGDAPMYIHGADAEWVMRPSPSVVLWEGETAEPVPGLTLVHLGGHFEGAAVVHWPDGAGGRGALLTGDTVQVVMDRRFVSFMWSYPNHVPLRPDEVRGIAARLGGYEFDRMYGAFEGRSVRSDARAALTRSATRYLTRMGAEDGGVTREGGG
ncbi:MAG TPA: hypothetical protein VG476_04990 [Acidimicrobiales bacterium]|nr:hypothetical protein [Acidimicrobiales bacterium]